MFRFHDTPIRRTRKRNLRTFWKQMLFLHPRKKVPTSHHPLLSLSHNLPCFSSLDSIWPIKPTYPNSSRQFLLIRRFSENLSSTIVNTRLQIFVDSHILQRHRRVLWKFHIIWCWLMQSEVFYFHFGDKINSLSLSWIMLHFVCQQNYSEFFFLFLYKR